MLPDVKNLNFMDKFNTEQKYSMLLSEIESSLSAFKCETIAVLNELTQKGKLRELIRINEALHEVRLSQIAAYIAHQKKKLVMLAGPSSSGKTTTANRLAAQLRCFGIKPILISLDDYYIERRQLEQGCKGEIDFEHIDAIDVALYREQVRKLADEEYVTLPHFDFVTGSRRYSGKKIRMDNNSIMIIEGIHALNPVLRPPNTDEAGVFRMFVIPVLPIKIYEHNEIPSGTLRLIRRIVRDFRVRGASVKKTLSMWNSVRKGEERWVFPFRDHADIIFDSATLYELAVLKKQANPMLLQMQPEDEGYAYAYEAVKILDLVLEADMDEVIPSSSVLREFIGGSSYL